MPVYYSVAIDSAAFRRELAGIEGALSWDQRGVERIGQHALDLIMRRTEQGLDYQYTRFAPYSEAYAAWKMKATAGRDVSIVDLLLRGTMLANMQAVAVPSKTAAESFDALLYFPNQQMGQRAHYHNATLEEDPRPRTKIPLRRFMAIEPGGWDELQLVRVAAEELARHFEEGK